MWFGATKDQIINPHKSPVWYLLGFFFIETPSTPDFNRKFLTLVPVCEVLFVKILVMLKPRASSNRYLKGKFTWYQFLYDAKI